MTAQALTGGLAPDIVLAPDYILRVTALDPATGNTVSGVVISDVSLQVDTIPDDKLSPKIKLQPPLLVHEVQV